MADLSRISVVPGKRGGRPCVRELRITVYEVLDWLASGMTEADILADHPDLEREDVLACLQYAANREPPRLLGLSQAPPILTIGDLQKRRTCKQFVDWVETTLRRFSETEESRAIGRGCAQNLDRRYKDAVKRFHEEALPFYVFVKSMYADSGAEVWLPADHGPYDAKLLVDGRTEGIQISEAIDGYDNARRMAILSREGSVPAHGPLHRTKKENGRRYDVSGELEAIPHESIVNDLVSLLADTIRAKRSKSYPSGTWLLVWYHDPLILNDRDYKLIEAVALEAARDLDFARVLLAGRVDPPSCKIILDRASETQKGI